VLRGNRQKHPIEVQKEIEVFISQFCVSGQRRGFISDAQQTKSQAIQCPVVAMPKR